MNPATPTPSPSPTPTDTTPIVKMVAVPDLVGLNQTSAERELRSLGLVPIASTEEGPEETIREVIRQNPEAREEVEEGTEVEFWINTGPDVKTIPSGIIGIPFENARAILNEAGFDNVKSEDAKPFDLDDSGTEPVNATKGNVLASSHDPGTEVSPDTEIVLTVATGTSVVPKLVDLSLAQAATLAGRYGFDVNPTEQETDEQPPGTVFNQDPSPNKVASRSTKIDITIAKAVTVVEPPDEPDNETDNTDNGGDQGGEGDGDNP